MTVKRLRLFARAVVIVFLTTLARKGKCGEFYRYPSKGN